MALAGMALADVEFGIGPSVGTTFGPDAGAFGSVVERADTVVGGQLVAWLTAAWSAELAAATFDDWDDEERFGVYGAGEAGITPLTLTLRYARPVFRNKARLYGGAGAGWYFYDDADLDITVRPGSEGLVTVGADPTVDMKDVFGYHAAFGLEWAVRENLELFIEYRFAFLEARGSISGVTANTPEGEQFVKEMRDDFIDNDELPIGRIGLNYRFGRF
jgi:hypothetical protein